MTIVDIVQFVLLATVIGYLGWARRKTGQRVQELKTVMSRADRRDHLRSALNEIREAPAGSKVAVAREVRARFREH